MANEIAVSYIAGRLVMTADVYQPDGTEREYAIALTDRSGEIGFGPTPGRSSR